MLDKNIFILWLQGWDNAPWLVKQVAESWEINNPGWKIHYIDSNNLKNYVTDIDYINDPAKNLSLQAKSDVIRLSLLKNHGGVWADATMLCMQPLDHWVFDAIEPAKLWMYHGHGAGMPKEIGPAIWFIISEKNGYMINKWKDEADKYWLGNHHPYTYCWLDEWFKILFNNDETFHDLWLQVPYLYCELDGQSHTLAHCGMENNTPHIKQLFSEKPPYALKFWRRWTDLFPDTNSQACQMSNGFFAIQMSKRRLCYRHIMT